MFNYSSLGVVKGCPQSPERGGPWYLCFFSQGVRDDILDVPADGVTLSSDQARRLKDDNDNDIGRSVSTIRE